MAMCISPQYNTFRSITILIAKEDTGFAGRGWIQRHRSAHAEASGSGPSNIDVEAAGSVDTNTPSNVTDGTEYGTDRVLGASLAAESSHRIGSDSVTGEKERLTMFTCLSKKLFHEQIKVQSNYNYDDRRTFMEIKKSYWKARGWQGFFSQLLRFRQLAGIKWVEVSSAVAFSSN